jgi:outer membrane murein-binding lipoprotein Lpp
MGLTPQQEAHLQMVLGLAAAVKTNALSIDQVSSPHLRESVREHLARQGYGGSARARGLVLQWQREDKERAQQRMRELRAAGCELYSPEQGVFTAVVRVCLDGCEDGTYPTARETAQAIAGDKAQKLLAKTSKKRMKQAYRDNKGHPAMKSICTVFDNSMLTAIASGSVSSWLGALANSHKLARRLERIEKETALARADAAAARAETVRANARIDTSEQWKADAERMYRAGKSFAAIADSTGKGKSTVNDYIRTQIRTGVLEAR